jgi:hypothetical protein
MCKTNTRYIYIYEQKICSKYFYCTIDVHLYVFFSFFFSSHSGSFPLTPGTNQDYLEFPSTYLKGSYAHYTAPKG